MFNIYLCLVVSNPDVEMEVTHEEEKAKDGPLVSELRRYCVFLFYPSAGVPSGLKFHGSFLPKTRGFSVTGRAY